MNWALFAVPLISQMVANHDSVDKCCQLIIIHAPDAVGVCHRNRVRPFIAIAWVYFTNPSTAAFCAVAFHAVSFSFRWLFEPSLSAFLAFLKVGIVVSVWLATPPVRKCAILAVCWVYMRQKLRQFLIAHSPDAVGVCLLLFRCNFARNAINANEISVFSCVYASTTAIFAVIMLYSHVHSPFDHCPSIFAPQLGQYLNAVFNAGSSKTLSYPQTEHLSKFVPSRIPPS